MRKEKRIISVRSELGSKRAWKVAKKFWIQRRIKLETQSVLDISTRIGGYLVGKPMDNWQRVRGSKNTQTDESERSPNPFFGRTRREEMANQDEAGQKRARCRDVPRRKTGEGGKEKKAKTAHRRN